MRDLARVEARLDDQLVVDRQQLEDHGARRRRRRRRCGGCSLTTMPRTGARTSMRSTTSRAARICSCTSSSSVSVARSSSIAFCAAAERSCAICCSARAMRSLASADARRPARRARRTGRLPRAAAPGPRSCATSCCVQQLLLVLQLLAEQRQPLLRRLRLRLRSRAMLSCRPAISLRSTSSSSPAWRAAPAARRVWRSKIAADLGVVVRRLSSSAAARTCAAPSISASSRAFMIEQAVLAQHEAAQLGCWRRCRRAAAAAGRPRPCRPP